ncbi:hypothetical protein BpHYR1_032967 [Brachionus plicatilis]|uniref:Uncharacterized protein n=1 Tax=Brachionus plicatilis TaxID=10195 RepID=A0A3M7RF25_BRAPC|nr:hypothetical protein BpHYR1_032967 [Brachionus plicatilis]
MIYKNLLTILYRYELKIYNKLSSVGKIINDKKFISIDYQILTVSKESEYQVLNNKIIFSEEDEFKKKKLKMKQIVSIKWGASDLIDKGVAIPISIKSYPVHITAHNQVISNPTDDNLFIHSPFIFSKLFRLDPFHLNVKFETGILMIIHCFVLIPEYNKLVFKRLLAIDSIEQGLK